MKKILGLCAIFVGTLLLTGCGGSNTYTCTVTYEENDESMTQELIAYLDDNSKVKSVDVVYTLSTDESAEALYQLYSYDESIKITKSGKKVTIKDAQEIEGSELNLVGKTKDEVKEFVTSAESNATCK